MKAVAAAAWSLLAGCGFAPHATADGGAAPTDSARDGVVASDGAPVDAPAAPFAMTGLRWTMPCITSIAGQAACTVADPAPPATTLTLDGDGGDHWMVTVHVLGVVEALGYTGGAKGSGDWYVGGGTGPDHANNFYSLAVSSPHVTYYVNNGTPGGTSVIDYTVSLPIDGNAMLSFGASGQDQYEWQDFDVATGSKYVVPGLATPPGLAGGQYAELEVVSATRM